MAGIADSSGTRRPILKNVSVLEITGKTLQLSTCL